MASDFEIAQCGYVPRHGLGVVSFLLPSCCTPARCDIVALLSVRSGSLKGQLRTFFWETATPMPHASGRSPHGGDRHGPNHTSSGALCVDLSELTSSIPIGVTGRELARGQRKTCLSTILSFGTLELCYERSAAQQWQRLSSVSPFSPLLSVPPTVPPSLLLSIIPPLLQPSLPVSLPVSCLPAGSHPFFLVPFLVPGRYSDL